LPESEIKNKTALIKTGKGEIIIEFYPEQTPLTVSNFIYLARQGFYNGLTFHRVEPGFVVQGGDPKGDGTGGPGYVIPAEINPDLKHLKGAVAMARLPDQINPERNSSGSQFYIALDELPDLDGAYTVFGRVVSGMDVVEKIRQGDVIELIEILEKE
jgi:peptidyl-prolyl cis-trans isomerase B (cyclophilin B)